MKYFVIMQIPPKKEEKYESFSLLDSGEFFSDGDDPSSETHEEQISKQEDLTDSTFVLSDLMQNFFTDHVNQQTEEGFLVFQHRLCHSLEEVSNYLQLYKIKMPAASMPERPSRLMSSRLNHIVIGVSDDCTEEALANKQGLFSMAQAFYIGRPYGFENKELHDALNEAENMLRYAIQLVIDNECSDKNNLAELIKNKEEALEKVKELKSRLAQEEASMFVEYKLHSANNEAAATQKSEKSPEQKVQETHGLARGLVRFFSRSDDSCSSDEELEWAANSNNKP